jgi:NAD dependent epimerase/dehydratase family enzyme
MRRMKVILFGGTGMVGQGALRECLAASDVERVLVVVRSSTDKLREVVQRSTCWEAHEEMTWSGIALWHCSRLGVRPLAQLGKS